jgi:hypothetical protein
MNSGQNESDSGYEGGDDNRFYLMIIPAHGKPECKEFMLKDDLVAELRSLSKKRVSCHVFEGQRWHISLPPRKLISPDGSIEADLSHNPDSVEIDLEGYLFEDPSVVDDDDDFES